MKTFRRFLERMINEDAPPPTGGAGGISAPGSLPGSSPMPPGGAMGGMPPPGMGGLGGGAGMPPMAGAPGASGPTTAPLKLKSYNVWDVLERVLDNSQDSHNSPHQS